MKYDYKPKINREIRNNKAELSLFDFTNETVEGI